MHLSQAICLAVAWFCPVDSTQAQTPITIPGTYPAGSYFLATNIVADIVAIDDYESAIKFTGPWTLDLNGKVLRNSADASIENKPNLSIGVDGSASGTLLDSSGGTGKVTGFHIGVKLHSPRTKVIGIDASENLFTGVWFYHTADDSLIMGGNIGNVGGACHSAYATGVQVDADRVRVESVRFRNIYQQKCYRGDEKGEGLPVNFSAQSSGGIMRFNVAINDIVLPNTYCVFAGERGGHEIEWNICHNFWRGIAAVTVAGTVIRNNTISIDRYVAGSLGIGGPNVERNRIIGPYEEPIIGDATAREDNVLISSPIKAK